MNDFNDIMNSEFTNSSISDELLAAYIDGNTTESENALIESTLKGDSILAEAYEIANDSVSLGSDFDWDINTVDYNGIDLWSQPILSSIDNPLNDNEEIIEEFSIGRDRFTNDETFLIQNVEYNLDDNTLNSSNMANNRKTIIYGEAKEDLFDPVYVQQPDDHSCALRSQQIILRDFGIDIPFKDLEQIALDHGVYTNEGTYTYDIGKVLQLAGVGMHQTEGNSIDDLINELALGHRVIVSVDAHELWYNKTMGEKMLNWLKDAIGLQGGNHALIVAGVEVDLTHPEDSKVILTDPGSGHLRIEYPMEQFKDAWGDSNCFMAATNNPAPYQYDAATGKEVPSNFAVQQYINDFVANNSYQLSPDRINIPDGYQPALTDHLNVVGSVDYDTFKSGYDEMVSNRITSTLSIKERIEEVAKTSAGHNIKEYLGDKSPEDSNKEIEEGSTKSGLTERCNTEKSGYSEESSKIEEGSGELEEGSEIEEGGGEPKDGSEIEEGSGEPEEGGEEDFDNVSE